MEIQVGEFIRTKGFICKVTKIMEQDEALPLYYCTDLGFGFLEKDIVKHSFNIIDLIEVGDYVNGYKVVEVTEYTFTTMEQGGYKVHHKECVTIKSIVTKEQFESIKYEV